MLQDTATESDIEELLKRLSALSTSEDLLDTQQAADYLHVTRSILATWRHNGKGPGYKKVGSRVLYRRRDIDEWLDACHVDTASSNSVKSDERFYDSVGAA